jgi:lysophospholipase L1-like esterase
VHGPSRGRLRFTGILDRLIPTKQRRLEVSNLAHGARWAEQDFGPLQRQAVAALGLDLTILMFGGNEGLGIDRSGDTSIAARYLRGLEARGRFARRRGGACLVIPPGRSGITTKTRHLLGRTAKVAAEDVGCTYAPVLDDIKPIDQWNSPSPFSDGTHPTARGYRLYANAVAPEVLKVLDDVTANLRAARGKHAGKSSR